MPAPKLDYTMTIRRVTGETMKLKLSCTIDDVRNAGAAIESGLAANYIGVVLDGKLVVIPSHQIAEITIDPAPNVLIAHVIKDAERV
jgi:hypothetical protein